MMVALGTAFMVIGVLLEVLDLSACALASLLVVFVYIEIGSYYPWLVWVCTSIVLLIIYPGSLVGIEYLLIFGIYPIIKAYVERLPKWSWIIVKLVYINAIIWALFFITELLLGGNFFGEETPIMTAIVYVLMNVAFVAYDFFITVMIRFYYEKLRPRFKKFLK